METPHHIEEANIGKMYNSVPLETEDILNSLGISIHQDFGEEHPGATKEVFRQSYNHLQLVPGL